MKTRTLVALLGACLLGGAALAQSARDKIVAALQHGGFVIVMRHASSPRTPPAAADAHPDNTARERQLDAVGRETADAMGAALHERRIPIGEVLSSPTFRAVETVRHLAVGEAELVPELGDGEALIIRPEGGVAKVIGRIAIAEWPLLADR